MSFRAKKPKTPNYDEMMASQNKQFIQMQMDQQNKFEAQRVQAEAARIEEQRKLKAAEDQKTLDEINATNQKKAKRRQSFLSSLQSQDQQSTSGSFLATGGQAATLGA